jgi:hypothetical protein
MRNASGKIFLSHNVKMLSRKSGKIAGNFSNQMEVLINLCGT